MIEIDITGEFPLSIAVEVTPEELENQLHDEISKGLAIKLMSHIDDMAFIDIKINEEKQMFEYNAELVICSKQDIISANEIMAQKLAKYGLNEKDIIDILSTQQESTGGF